MTKYKLLEFIKLEIKKEFKFTNKFCEKANLSRFNMSKIFNGQDMSIGTLIKTLKTLKKLPPEHNCFKGLNDLNSSVLLDLYNNRKELEVFFKVLEEIEKNENKLQ